MKSNAIVYAKDGARVGIGAGQMTRRRGPHRRLQGRGSRQGGGAEESLAKGSVVASDAFFPFPDGLLATIEAARARSSSPAARFATEVIAAADEAGIAMVFTGVRHFRH